MTYYLVALENTKARLIASETRTTDKRVADMVERDLKQRGFVVLRRQEE